MVREIGANKIHTQKIITVHNPTDGVGTIYKLTTIKRKYTIILLISMGELIRS